MQLLRRLRDAATTDNAIDGTMLGLGALTGFITGLLAAVLIEGIRLIQHIGYGTSASSWKIVLVPTVGGLLVGLIVRYWAVEPSGSGVVRLMETLALRGGRTRRRTPTATLVAASVALGTGASGGREGPIVLVGGSVGSIIGQWMGIDAARLRALIAAGAAAGIGASFNAPIGGMLFAIELILGRLRATSLQVVVVGAVVGSITARALVGPGIIYEPRVTYALGDARQLLLFAGLGLAAALTAVLLQRFEHIAMRGAAALRTRGVPVPVVVGLGGLGVGLVGLLIPEVLGTGENLPPIDGFRDPIQRMLDGGYGTGFTVAGFLLLLALAKLVATVSAVGAGHAVGTFAPAVFIGAALGAGFGAAAAVVFPDMGIQPGAFALVGTAAVFAGAARAPLTAILIAFELTGDYGLVLPLMLAAGISVFVAARFEEYSVYEHPLRQRGIVFAEPEDVDMMQVVTVGDVMSTGHTVIPELPIDELEALFDSSHHHGFAVVEHSGRLVGVVTLEDLARRRDDTRLAVDICTKRPATVSPRDPVHAALHRMATLDVGRVPVVEAGNRYVGLIRRSDVVDAYQSALLSRLGDQQATQQSQLRDLIGTRFVELTVVAGAPADGLGIAQVKWPARTLLTNVRRGSETIVPTGATVLQPGDELVVLTEPDEVEDVRQLVAMPGSLPGGHEDPAPIA